MKKYDIELEALTPLAVGAGDENSWMPGADFIQKGGYVHVLDIQKMHAEGIDMEKLSLLFLKSDGNGITDLIGSKLDRVTKYKFKCNIQSSNPIKTFLRSQLYDKPLVAGSSLKGAIRSALFNTFRSESEKDNNIVFGALKDGQDFMRFIHVGDIEMPDTMLLNSKIFNLQNNNGEWAGGWKHGGSKTNTAYSPSGFNTIYECVAPHLKGHGTITLTDDVFQMMDKGKINHLDKKSGIINGGTTELFKAINSVTEAHLRKERAFFEAYPAERSDEIIVCIDRLLSMIPSDGSSCILKMSAGAGFHSITGDWRYKDYTNTGIKDNGKKKYKSRKTVEYDGSLQLMGFVRLRTMSSEEVRNVIAATDISHASKLKDISDAANQKIAEMQRKQEEEDNRRRAAEDLKQRTEQYNLLLEEAAELRLSKKWEEAIAKAQQAGTLQIDDMRHEAIIKKCEEDKKFEEINLRTIKEREEQLSQPLSEFLSGKSSVGNIIGSTATWLKKNNQSFGSNELEAVVAAVKALPPKKQAELGRKRKDIVKALGDDATHQLLATFGIE